MPDSAMPTTAAELELLAKDFIDLEMADDDDRDPGTMPDAYLKQLAMAIAKGVIDPPMTNAERELRAKVFIDRTMADDLGPGPMTDAELELLAKDFFNRTMGADLGPGPMADAYLARHIHRMAACGLFEQQLLAHQRQHKISALIEERFVFVPLSFTTTWQRLGRWLEPLGDDAAQLRRSAKRLGQEFKALADGAGAGWLRYRLLNFETEDGRRAWRYVCGWDGMDAALQQADSAELDYGLGVELEELGFDDDAADGAAIELSAWIGDWGSGDAHFFLLVRPDLARQLDATDAWWGGRDDEE